MFHDLSLLTSVVRLANAQAAGLTDFTSSALDMEDYDGVLFICAAGAVSATAVSQVKIQQSSDDGSTDAYADLAGTFSAALVSGTDDNKVILIDVYRPQERYLKVVWHRSTANTVIDGIFAIRYHGKVMPAALDATVKALTKFSAPAEGAA